MTAGAVALRDWMVRRGLNQREAAKVLAVHYMCLNQYLSGKRRPQLAVALRIEAHAGLGDRVVEKFVNPRLRMPDPLRETRLVDVAQRHQRADVFLQ